MSAHIEGAILATPELVEYEVVEMPMYQSVEDLIERVRAEYLEMPGLQLTDLQASRLWALDKSTCQRLLHALLDARFLTRTADGRYRRAES